MATSRTQKSCVLTSYQHISSAISPSRPAFLCARDWISGARIEKFRGRHQRF